MMQKTELVWVKMSGAGNSFWISDFLSPFNAKAVQFFSSPGGEKKASHLAQVLCSGHFRTTHPSLKNRGKTLKSTTSPKDFFFLKKAFSKADGMAILLPSKVCDFKWLFYNRDGSSADMCGNSACCVMEYIFKKKLYAVKNQSKAPEFITLETGSQAVKGDWHKGFARIFLRQSLSQGPFNLYIKGKKISYMFINSSLPHAVVDVQGRPGTSWQEWENISARQNDKKPGQKSSSHSLQLKCDKTLLAKALRKHTAQHKNGMNVSFYQKPISFQGSKQQELDTGELFACTFERGVEDFTLACGTGAMAVAQVYRQHFAPQMKTILVRMPGGLLEIDFHSDNMLSLKSPVKWLEEKTLEMHF